MDESELMHSFNREDKFGHVEASNVLREDLVLDQHGHQVSTREELHQHVQESRVLERGMKLDKPWAVGIGENVTLSSNVSELVFLELFEYQHLAATVPLRESHTISALINDFSAYTL